MEIKISEKGLIDTEKLIADLTKTIKTQVIDVALDSELNKDLQTLKANLMTTITKELVSPVPVQTTDAGEEQVPVKKSDQEMIKHLTGVDLSKINKTKDFNTLADGKLAVVQNKVKTKIDKSTGDSTSKMSAGVNLRLPMSQGDTFENQYSRALNYYNNAMFVFTDSNNRTNYYLNPGMDLTPYIKVVCSTEAGDGKPSTDRWDRISKNGTDHADWTLLRSGLDVVKQSFINITDVVDKMKEGDFDTASGVLQKVGQKSQSVGTYTEKIDNLKNDTKLDPTVSSYNNAVKLIRNLKLEKSIKKDRTFYTLVSTYDADSKDYQDFQQKLMSEVKMWKLANQQKYVATMIKAIVTKLRSL